MPHCGSQQVLSKVVDDVIYGLHRTKGNAPLLGCSRPGECGPYGVGWSEPDPEEEPPEAQVSDAEHES
ncbi:hypothetical protein [Streptomyces violascens]|uniref:hypothetical protein n=1 Tax=Streptomyces violascens TaxID=67381 RepID=UPI00368773A2